LRGAKIVMHGFKSTRNQRQMESLLAAQRLLSIVTRDKNISPYRIGHHADSVFFLLL